MAITYTKAQKDRAKAEGLKLVTIDAHGLSFQGPTTAEECAALEAYILAFVNRRGDRPKPAVVEGTPNG